MTKHVVRLALASGILLAAAFAMGPMMSASATPLGGGAGLGPVTGHQPPGAAPAAPLRTVFARYDSWLAAKDAAARAHTPVSVRVPAPDAPASSAPVGHVPTLTEGLLLTVDLATLSIPPAQQTSTLSATDTTGPVVVNVTFPGSPAQQWTFTPPSGEGFQAGAVYSTGDAAQISNGSPLQGAFEVDAFQSGVGGDVTSLGIQFEAFSSTSSPGLGFGFGLGSVPSQFWAGSFAIGLPSDGHQGYYIYGPDGELQGFGNNSYLDYLGTPLFLNLNAPVVGMAVTPDGRGYWMAASDGGIFAYGDAAYDGSMGGTPLNQPIVGLAAAPDGGGYWLVAADGGIFSFGDALYHGSMGGSHLNQPIVGMTPTSDGDGYWMVASDGGIFSFGDASFHGSMGATPLNQPIVGMAASDDGDGYWLVAADGGIFSFGDAFFQGSMGGTPLNEPVVGMAADPAGPGYWLVAADGGIFAFGGAPFDGSIGGEPGPFVVGMTA